VQFLGSGDFCAPQHGQSSPASGVLRSGGRFEASCGLLGSPWAGLGSTRAELEVRVHCLALGGVDLTSSTGKLTMNVLNAVAEFERDLLVERTQAGLSRAKAEGKTLGRPSSLTEDQRREIERRLREGITVSALAREFNTSRQTIMRVRNAVPPSG